MHLDTCPLPTSHTPDSMLKFYTAAFTASHRNELERVNSSITEVNVPEYQEKQSWLCPSLKGVLLPLMSMSQRLLVSTSRAGCNSDKLKQTRLAVVYLNNHSALFKPSSLQNAVDCKPLRYWILKMTLLQCPIPAQQSQRPCFDSSQEGCPLAQKLRQQGW